MTSLLLLIWNRALHPEAEAAHKRREVKLPQSRAPQTSTSIFLVLRRMRMPLILLIVVFAVSVLGLSLIPGEDAEGRPVRMSIFDSFYFMSYTATTIGFGEIPYPLTHPQRLWVTFSIFLSVIGWAYAIGTLLVRVLARTDSTESMMVWLMVSIALGSTLLAWPQWVPVRGEHLWLIAGVGLSGALAQYAITEAFRRGEASLIAPLEYTALVWGVLLDLTLWGVLPDGVTWIGAGIIVASGLYVAHRERRRAALPAPGL